MSLHKNQIAVLKLLEEHIDMPLTMRQIQEELNLSSPSVVAHHIQKLESKGYLKRNPHNPRDYQTLSNPENPIIYLNLYGSAQCGKDGSILDGNPVDKIPISTKLLKFPGSDAFMVVAKGDSMTPHINEGDFVIVQKKETANIGDTIVCVYDDKVLIKKYFPNSNQITLVSSNQEKHPPIVVSEYFKIEGVVRNIISYK